MKLKWQYGLGPATTQELADEIEKEGRLTTHTYVASDGTRCLWGVIRNCQLEGPTYCSPLLPSNFLRSPTRKSQIALFDADITTLANDEFEGTPEERCQEMARRVRAIP